MNTDDKIKARLLDAMIRTTTIREAILLTIGEALKEAEELDWSSSTRAVMTAHITQTAITMVNEFLDTPEGQQAAREMATN